MYIQKRKDVEKDEFVAVFENRKDEAKQHISEKYYINKKKQMPKTIFVMEKKKMKGKKIMIMKELCDVFYSYQNNKVKNTTLYTYVQRSKYFNVIVEVKLHELSIEDYKLWRKNLDDSNLSTSYKNNILKFFKEILRFAEKW